MGAPPWLASPFLLPPVLPCLFLLPPALRAVLWARQLERHGKLVLLRQQGEWGRLRRLHLPHTSWSSIARPACRCPPFDEEYAFCRHGAFSLFWCLSHRAPLTTKKFTRTVLSWRSQISRNLFCLKSTSELSGPSKDSSSSISSFNLWLTSR